MSYRPHGKHVVIDRDNPEALGICDYTGFVFRRVDLVRQMEWRGNALVWTGFYVGKPYEDKPNEQLRPPILPPDPVPVREPRLQQPSIVTWSTTTTIWNQSQNLWVEEDGVADGTPVLTEAQRLSQLGNVYFGGYNAYFGAV